jgi:hypothetical protein
MTEHPFHAPDGPADCARCQLLRDEMHWMEPLPRLTREIPGRTSADQQLAKMFPGLDDEAAGRLIDEADDAHRDGEDAAETLGVFIWTRRHPITGVIESEARYRVHRAPALRGARYAVTELAREDRPAL